MKLRSHNFCDLTWKEIEEAVQNNLAVILPIGATEQHSYHLPLSTDTLLATSLSLEVAKRTNSLVAPAISYGYRSRPQSGGGQGFVGTTSVSGITLINTVNDVISEFIRHGFKKIIVLNWHMENTNFVYEGVVLAEEKTHGSDVKIMVMEDPYPSLPEETKKFVYPEGHPGSKTEHAAIIETSLMLYLYPDLVLMDRAVDDEAELITFYEVVPTPDHLITKSGTLWKATQASYEKGKRSWPEIVDITTNTIVAEFDRK